VFCSSNGVTVVVVIMYICWFSCSCWQIITVQCGVLMMWAVCVMLRRAGSHAAAVSTCLGMPILVFIYDVEKCVWWLWKLVK